MFSGEFQTSIRKNEPLAAHMDRAGSPVLSEFTPGFRAFRGVWEHLLGVIFHVHRAISALYLFSNVSSPFPSVSAPFHEEFQV